MTQYELLGVPSDASPEAIRAAFQNQMNQKSSGSDAAADQRRQQLQTAYVVLSDAELRATYDLRLAGQTAAAVALPAASRGTTRMASASEIAADDNQPAAVLARDAFLQQRWAGFWARVAAQIIDGFVLYIPGALAVALIVAILTALHANPPAAFALGYLAYFVIFVVYSALLNASDGLGTLGRRATGLAVVSATSGEQISTGLGYGRAMMSLISAVLVFPNFLQLFTEKRQSLSDLIAGTVVVRKRPGGSAVVVVVAVACVIIIPLIGILAAIAIPAYQDFTIRARVNEALSNGAAYKSLVSQNALSGATDLSTGFSAPSASVNIERVEVSRTGVITVTMAPIAKNVTFRLIPSWAGNHQPLNTAPPAASAISWTCQVDDVKSDRYVPAQCRI